MAAHGVIGMTTPIKAKTLPASKPLTIRGWAGYATVLRELQRRPSTTLEIAQHLGCCYHGLGIILGRMCDLGLVHEREWVAGASKKSPKSALWACGDGERAPKPSTGKLAVREPKQYRHRPELISFASIIRSLRTDNLTSAELAEVTGCTVGPIGRLMRHGQAIGLFRVAAWVPRETGNGKPSMCWGLGSGKSAPRPATLSRQEIDTRHWARRKAKAEQMVLIKALAGVAPARELVAA